MTSEKRSAMVGIMVPEKTREELEAIAGDQERSLSWVGGALLERGLEAFRKDGILRVKKQDLKLVPKRRRSPA